jgi:hypothetical protein
MARLGLALSIGVMSALAAGEVAAKAAYRSLEDTMANAEIVAVVHAELAEPAKIQGEVWVYSQRVTTRVIEPIKGAPGKRMAIVANKNFICAPAPLHAPGDYLVFLAPDNGHLATVNHYRGALKINDGNVEWPYGDEHRSRPLTEVVLELRAMVDDPAPQEDLETYTEREMQEEAEPIEEPCAAPIMPDFPVEPAPAEPAPASWRAPLTMASGAFAVLLGMLVASRRRRR